QIRLSPNQLQPKLSSTSNHQKTTTYRRNSTHANFTMDVSRAAPPAPFPDCSDETRSPSSDQRPANSILATFVLRRRFPTFRPKVGRLFDGMRSARNPSKLSDVTRPSAASCDSASSTCEGSSPLRRTSSEKNNAPPLRSASKRVWLPIESS